MSSAAVVIGDLRAKELKKDGFLCGVCACNYRQVQLSHLGNIIMRIETTTFH